MSKGLLLPFNPLQFPLAELRQIQAADRLALVAINCDGTFVSINFSELQAGDLALFQGPGKLDPIVKYQERLLPKPAAQWTHVGIFDRHLMLWDAMPNLHVRCRPLREVLREETRIGIFRPNVPIDANKLAENLLLFSNHQYKVFSVETGGSLAARLMQAGSDRTQSEKESAGSVICSMFVDAVLRRTTGYPFLKTVPIAIPGDFANDADFSPVEIAWCRVVA